MNLNSIWQPLPDANHREGWEIMSQKQTKSKIGFCLLAISYPCWKSWPFNFSFLAILPSFMLRSSSDFIKSEKLFCTETIFNPLYPAETRPNCSRICRTWTCSHHPADSFWKQVSFINTSSIVSSFPPDPNIKESTKTKSPAFTMAGRFASKAPMNPSPNAYNTTGITVRGKQEAKRGNN